jgi:hypothetical protein
MRFYLHENVGSKRTFQRQWLTTQLQSQTDLGTSLHHHPQVVDLNRSLPQFAHFKRGIATTLTSQSWLAELKHPAQCLTLISAVNEGLNRIFIWASSLCKHTHIYVLDRVKERPGRSWNWDLCEDQVALCVYACTYICGVKQWTFWFIDE